MKDRPLKPRIFMMDLWAIVPYYTAYLSRALLQEGACVQVGSISYYLDPKCFSSRGLKLDPGLLDIVGRLPLPRVPRRIFKAIEALINMSALSVRFFFSAPEIIHVQYLPMLQWNLPLDSWFLLLCKQRGSRIVLTVHDLLPHDSAGRYKEVFFRLYHRVDHLICHSEHVRSRLIAEFEIDSEKIAVIPHGPFFYDLPTGARSDSSQEEQHQLSVLWQGIIFPYKGLDVLLDAWQKVELADANASLVVMGTGAPSLLDEVREQVRRLGLQRVMLDLRFTSAEELVAAYRMADIVVYPYRAITTSGALATGLALGKAIIASDLPVFRELLVNGSNALLVSPQDDEALSQAIIYLAENSQLRKKFADAVTKMNCGDSSWTQIAKETLDVYGKLLQ
jgi:glycosyltransferase involved in cell wall biosynthesis